MNRFRIVMNNGTDVYFNLAMSLDEFSNHYLKSTWAKIDGVDVIIQVSNISSVHLVKE